MSQKIESDKLFIKDVFQKWYRIPEYQRPYVWGDDQVGELLEDVRRARESNPQAQYFLGSMVLQKNRRQTDATSYEEYDLLDGQQRLTTLFLITAVIRDLTPASNGARKKTCQDSLDQMANPDDNVPERSRIVFDIRDEVRDEGVTQAIMLMGDGIYYNAVFGGDVFEDPSDPLASLLQVVRRMVESSPGRTA